MAIARGQITLVDLTDVNFQGFLTSSKSKMQSLSTSGTVYTPSWDGSANKVSIAAEIYQIGQTANLIQNSMVSAINWYFTLGTGARTLITTSMTADGYTLVNGTNGKPYTLEISKNKMTSSQTTLKIECEITYKHTGMESAQVYKLDIDYALAVQGATGAQGNTGATGSTGITTLLSKENYNVPCNQSGTPNTGWDTASASTVTVYQGASAVDAVATISANKQFSIALGTQTGCTASKVGNDGFKLATVTADSGSVEVIITVRDEKAATQTIKKLYTFVKAKAGVNARALTLSATGTTFFLNESKSAIATGSSSYTVTANAQNLGGSFAWTYKIDNGSETAWTGTETSKTVTWNSTQFPSSAKAVTIKVTRDGLSDSLTFVAVGNGFSPVLTDLTTPLGYIFRNGDTAGATSYLECDMNLYKDGSAVNATSYAWFFQGASGWEAITAQHVTDGFIAKADGDSAGTASHNKKVLRVLPKAVLNIENFKCDAVYGGKTYSAIVSLTDLTDPYTLSLMASKGTTFKNGQGSTDLTCYTYHLGAIVDASTLTHKWLVFDKNGNPKTVTGVTDKTTQTVTVSATQVGVGQTATIECEVSEKTPATGMSLHYKLEALRAMAEEQGIEASELPEANQKFLKWSLKDLLK